MQELDEGSLAACQGIHSFAINAVSLRPQEDALEVGLIDFACGDLAEAYEKIVIDALAEDGVVSVFGVLIYELPHPSRQGKSLPYSCLIQELADAADHLLCLFAVLSAVHFLLDYVVYPWEVSLTEQDLLDAQLLYHWQSCIVDVGPKVELFS